MAAHRHRPRVLAEGTERIYSFLRSRRTWDGQWLVVAAAVPESQRSTRHKLRTRLTRLGSGCPTPGMWIIPDADKEDEVQGALSDPDLADRAFARVGRRAAGTDPASLIDAARDSAEVRTRYRGVRGGLRRAGRRRRHSRLRRAGGAHPGPAFLPLHRP
uniref:Uncharacterized protein n=1 Tax=Janibacter limosus TaxID=53458 RepID=A0AC61U682_9MICO|nr:hypothetical protein [Janibacter limosus]